MSNAKWIWYRGDFEIYHNMMLHNRHKDYGFDYPSKWHVCRPECTVKFRKTFDADSQTVFTVVTNSHGMVEIGGDKHLRAKPNTQITLEKGHYSIFVHVYDYEGFPSIFIDSEYLKTDESWLADHCDDIRIPVDCEPEFTKATDNPTVFPFSRTDLQPLEVTEQQGGMLYDFGNEFFGPVVIESEKADDTITFCCGESREEALDYEFSIAHDTLTAQNGKLDIGKFAFRYIFVKSASGAKLSVKAQNEYLDIPDKADFECDDELVKKIWDVCSYTFHLNSREFYLDGIKRDHWVWSGDAYQSYMINRYLYDDPAIIKRTIKALLGRPPIIQHVNTINDYSAYLIIAVWEYYFATGDKKFVCDIWDTLYDLYNFIERRLINGYVVEYEEDWVFIDWSEIDKKGAVCTEQILLWQVYNSMANLNEVIGNSGDELREKAADLKKRIINDYYDESRCAFIDSFESGKNHISRHANIFAILYDFVDKDTAEKIAENVLFNDEITQITTPYFKLYELMALSKLGKIEQVQQYIDSYWGGMIKLGAQTIWEEFNPGQTGLQHYEMYGGKYTKSLCHAWGSGPIYLLGRYVLGVYPTSVGGKTFNVEPNPGKYKSFKAHTPINGGTVSVEYSDGKLTVTSTVPGGTLIFGGKQYEIIAGETLNVE